MKLGQAIKTFRKQKFPELSQPEFAEKLGITTNQLSRIENQKTLSTGETLKKIADALEVPLPVIFMASLEEEDLRPEKRDNFRMFHQPTIERTVKELT